MDFEDKTYLPEFYNLKVKINIRCISISTLQKISILCDSFHLVNMFHSLHISAFVLFFSNFGNGEIVKTTSGLVSGNVSMSKNGREFLAYWGIPYAAPPIGNLRLKVSKNNNFISDTTAIQRYIRQLFFRILVEGFQKMKKNIIIVDYALDLASGKLYHSG